MKDSAILVLGAGLVFVPMSHSRDWEPTTRRESRCHRSLILRIFDNNYNVIYYMEIGMMSRRNVYILKLHGLTFFNSILDLLYVFGYRWIKSMVLQ